MDAKKLFQVVRDLLTNNPTNDAWQIYYKVRTIDDSVTQRRIASAVKRIKKPAKTKKFQSDCFLSTQFSAKKYDD